MTPEMILVVAIALAGACVGSFLNVVAWRLPRACMSIVRPRSRCPRCAHEIAWYDNLPVLSWVLLRGRCRGCGVGISVRYPLVEALCALLFVVVLRESLGPAGRAEPFAVPAWQWGELGARLLATAALLVLSLVDLDHRILPDELTLGGIVAGLVLAPLLPGLQPSLGPLADELSPRLAASAHAFLGAISAGGGLWLLGYGASKLFRKDAMGLGDVKMLAAMGAWLGFWAWLSLFVASVVGALVGMAVLLVKRERYIPFGPFLAIGAWVVMLWGPEISTIWLEVFARR